MSRAVFFGALGLTLAFLGVSLAFRRNAERLFTGLLDAIAHRFDYFFALSVVALLVFCVWLMLGRFSHVRLGRDDEPPEFSTLSWLSMLFSAGMGIGLVFFSVAEPLMHYAAPPLGEARTPGAARRAMQLTFFHWGLHAWAVYTVMGAVLAYFCFRRGRPLLIRSAFEPVLGERVHGPIGHLIDILAVVSTLFGLATSLGLGAMQINSGLAYIGLLPDDTVVQIAIICVVTACATASLMLGLDKGVRRLSVLNVSLGGLLLVFVGLTGPTAYLGERLIANVAGYLEHFVARSLWLDALGPEKWRANWTIFYWAWWIAWAPFVGTFIARVSRGRTLREFVLGVLLVPSLVTFVWLTVFGDTALLLEREHMAPIADAVELNSSVAIYALLDALPLHTLSSLLTVVVVGSFFVSSSDSGSLVIDTLTSGGMAHPPVWQRIFWALMEGAVAAILLLAGGLKALQAAAVTTGLPFCALMLLMCVSFTLALSRNEGRARAEPHASVPRT